MKHAQPKVIVFISTLAELRKGQNTLERNPLVKLSEGVGALSPYCFAEASTPLFFVSTTNCGKRDGFLFDNISACRFRIFHEFASNNPTQDAQMALNTLKSVQRIMPEESFGILNVNERFPDTGIADKTLERMIFDFCWPDSLAKKQAKAESNLKMYQKWIAEAKQTLSETKKQLAEAKRIAAIRF